ncbi:tyrosine-protein kinase receptor UFO-like isoform X4 [Melopsittacus undulatus]|uniref:tyrosine-protein kinase receptor UFO-like isoform X1 n=1 Tax=Melopsittacus undulatus TaxID=13146 RepID=UPI00146F7DF2|nr:tyrosine-protein kinase receptor UFO-like isoform X1 [Melopsittacus undulatus]XP_033928093.1 tyrosine-protein kinase receptor UFO-like isoform X2 [Melopsittacus undulatus]XP_033928094.1 tyrosine-protein kinase receptor UFO-like isoform X3 [Melopsittacus undulatus]XP_033928095.1 tyrosine-protein kinase receptor UFO-like isoform X4 [Melopsittacus undulatus]
MGVTQLRLTPVLSSHSGRYRCWARAGGQQLLSPEAHLELAGLPQFHEEPQDAQVPLGGALTLRCGARGPPEPVSIRWLRDGRPLEGPAANGSGTLRMRGAGGRGTQGPIGNNRDL